LIKIIIKEENFKWHLEAFASELFTYFNNLFLGSFLAVILLAQTGNKQLWSCDYLQ